MKVKNRDQLIRTGMDVLKSLYSDIDGVVSAMCNIFGRDAFDSKIGELLYSTIDCKIELLALTTNTHIDEINWFVYECNFGENPLECVLKDGTEILVDDVESFLKTI